MNKSDLSQSQSEAVVDILVLAMCVDGHFSLIEDEKICEKMSALGWSEDVSLDHHVTLSLARARGMVESPEALQGYVEKLAEVLGTSEAKTFALERAMEILTADGMKAEEGQFVSQLRAVFKV